jgi:hypothetical protein
MAQSQAAAVRGRGVFRARRALAGLLGVAAALTALVFLPGRLHHVNGEVVEFAVLSPQNRIFRAARGVDVDTGIYLLAERVIPLHATYYVITGPGVRVSTPITYDGVGAFGIVFLMPRIPVQDVREARYVISYGGDLHKLGMRIVRVWTYQPGMQVAEVAR